MGGQGYEVNISGDVIRLLLKDFDHHFVNKVDRCAVNEDFHSISCALLFRLAIWNVSGNEADLKVKSFLVSSGVNDIHHSVMAVHSRQQVTEESSRKDIICGGETMSAKENPTFC